MVELATPAERVARFVGLLGPFFVSDSDIEARVNAIVVKYEHRSPAELAKDDITIAHCVQVAQALDNLERRTAERIEAYVRPCYAQPNEPLELRRSELAGLYKGEPRSQGLDLFGYRMNRLVAANDSLLSLRHADFLRRQREAQEQAERAEEARKAAEERRLAKEREEQAQARAAAEARAREEAEARRRASLTPEQRAAEDRAVLEQARRMHAMRCEMLQMALGRAIDEGSASKVMAIEIHLKRQGCQ